MSTSSRQSTPCTGNPTDTAHNLIPFEGDICGSSWNARAFFRKQGRRFNQKCKLLRSMLNSFDFVCLTDTHSTTESVQAFRNDARNQQFRSWWSHETATRGGVGITVNMKFLDQFYRVEESDWEECIPGRLARLRLRGSQGRLDIWVALTSKISACIALAS